MRVLDPIGVTAPPVRHLAQRPDDLRGLRIGLVHNGKPGGRRLLERAGQRLEAEHGVASVTYVAKPHPSAPGHFVPRVAGKIDAAVGALSD
jgi:hypothetical protein